MGSLLHGREGAVHRGLRADTKEMPRERRPNHEKDLTNAALAGHRDNVPTCLALLARFKLDLSSIKRSTAHLTLGAKAGRRWMRQCHQQLGDVGQEHHQDLMQVRPEGRL